MLSAAHQQQRLERQHFLSELTHVAEIPNAGHKYAQALREFYLREFQQPIENHGQSSLTAAQKAQIIAERLKLMKGFAGHG